MCRLMVARVVKPHDVHENAERPTRANFVATLVDEKDAQTDRDTIATGAHRVCHSHISARKRDQQGGATLVFARNAIGKHE